MYSPTTQEETIALDLFRAARHMKRKFQTEAKKQSVSFGQLQALLSIKFGKSSMKDVADDLCIAFPTATIMVDKLVQEDYIERVHDTKDRRIVRLSLTDKGKSVLKKSFSSRMKSVQSLLEQLTVKDRADLERIVKRINEKLETEDAHGK